MDKNLKIESFVNEKKLNRYIDRLYPICRSILGKGYRDSLKILGEIVDLNILNSIDEDDGLETSTTNITFIDENDNLLIGTTNGFSKISFNNSLTQYDSKYGIGGYVWAPIKRIDGKLYFGSTKDLYTLNPSYNSMKNNMINILGFNDMMGEFHKFDNSIIGVHNYGLSRQ